MKFVHKIILGIVTIIVLWMVSGAFTSVPKLNKVIIDSGYSVKAKPSKAQVKSQYSTLIGTGVANHNVDIVPLINASIVKQFAQEGDKLKRGDPILQLENKALIERIQQMQVSAETAQLQYVATTELYKKQLSSKLDLDNAKLSLSGAKANLLAAQSNLDNSIIRAPFDGIIDSLFFQEGDIASNMGAGINILGKFINLEDIEIHSYISQKEYHSLKNSTKAIIFNDQYQSMDAKVTFISQSADEQSGTFLLKAVAKNSLNIIDGEIVKLKIKIGDINAHNIPISALIIDKDGDVSIKTIDNSKSIDQYKVVIIDEDENGIWVSGLPNECNVVLAGQSYIK